MAERTYRLLLAMSFAAGAAAQPALHPEVSKFFEGTPIHGVPVDAAQALAALVDLEQLSALLEPGTDENRWEQVTTLLAVLPDDGAADALIEFIERRGLGDVAISHAHQNARQGAIVALGHQVSLNGNRTALDYLIGGLTPVAWRGRRVEGLAPGARSYAESDLQLSQQTVLALGFSGHPDAGEALRLLRDFPTAEQAEFRAGLDGTLAQWLEVNALVAEHGLAGMFEYYEARGRARAAQP